MAAFALAVVGLTAGAAVSDSLPMVDVARTISGPASGQVGEVLTYTATLRINGPDVPPGSEEILLTLDSLDGGVSGVSPAGIEGPCGAVAANAGFFSFDCNYNPTIEHPLQVGTTETAQLSVNVVSLRPTRICASPFGQSPRETDPNPGNDSQCITLNPAPEAPPPPTTTITTPTVPVSKPFSFAKNVPNATQYFQYFAALIVPQPVNLQPSPYVTLASGKLPPGISMSDNGDLSGKPTSLGAFTFTVKAQWPQVPSTAKQTTFELLVNAIENTPSNPQPGKTVRLAKRTETRGCSRGALPDRQCSPGAYFSGLTKAVLCSSTFRTGTSRNLPDSEKHQVEVEYGMTPKAYGRTIEIDQIVSLEIGGSNDIANLFPEPVSGKANYHVKDKLENRLHKLVCAGTMTLHAAQRGIARNWERLYKTVFGVAP